MPSIKTETIRVLAGSKNVLGRQASSDLDSRRVRDLVELYSALCDSSLCVDMVS
jgi:hypothetical protein